MLKRALVNNLYGIVFALALLFIGWLSLFVTTTRGGRCALMLGPPASVNKIMPVTGAVFIRE